MPTRSSAPVAPSRRRLTHFVRTTDTGLLDTCLVVAVLTILTIRVYLKAAHYPQVGGRGLHVAHVLWGGLGMIIAIVLLLSFLTRPTKRIAAVIGGIGFGAFIDELGKFVTSDNNYFFKPTAALIYSVFIVLFLTARQIRRARVLTPAENLVNAVELAKTLATERITYAQRERAIALLGAADQRRRLVKALRAEFIAADPVEDRPSRVGRLVMDAEARYARMVRTRWFHRALTGVFIVQAGGAFFLGLVNADAIADAAGVNALTSSVHAVGSIVSGGFIVAGVATLRRARLHAYRWFEFAVLVDLFLGQPFGLVAAGFTGLLQVFFDLALLATLRFMITQEHQLAAKEAGGSRS